MPALNNTTTVTETELEISDLLAQPGAESILLPGEKDDSKNNLFSRKPVDLTFLDKPTPKKEEITDPEEIAKLAAKKEADIKAGILNEDGTPKKSAAVTTTELDNLGTEDSDDVNKGGRRKTDKDGLYEFTKKLIEKKMLTPFEDDKKLEDYTMEDYQELFEANDTAKKQKLEEEVPVEFFKSLPDKLKYAAKYVADGGQDLKGLFSALAESERTAELDPTTEPGQEAIARQYLQSTWKDATADEIEEQLNEWKDTPGLLEKKANTFKPKLDTLQEEFIAYKVQEQEAFRKKQEVQAQAYMKNVYEVLEPGDLNGIKLDKKTQSMLYTGLTQPTYTSVSGKQTNLLGHLLEKYQWVEPKHDLIAEALWLLQDPEGYKNKLREGGKKEAVIDTVRKLKTEESKKIASTTAPEDNDDTNKSKGLKRPLAGNMFKRQ